MKVSFKRPDGEARAVFLKAQSSLPLSYAEQGFATGTSFPSGYDHDRNEVLVGSGKAVFEKVKRQIQQYDHFPEGWAFWLLKKLRKLVWMLAFFSISLVFGGGMAAGFWRLSISQIFTVSVTEH